MNYLFHDFVNVTVIHTGNAFGISKDILRTVLLLVSQMECDPGQMTFNPVLGMPTSILKYGEVKNDTNLMFVVIPGSVVLL